MMEKLIICGEGRFIGLLERWASGGRIRQTCAPLEQPELAEGTVAPGRGEYRKLLRRGS